MAARFDHARFVGVPLTEDLSLDLPAMLAAIREHQPKLVFLAVPNNPTGGLWPAEQVQAVIDAAPGLVVIDEAYQPFADGTWMPRVLDLPTWWSCAPCPRSDWRACASATWPAAPTGSPS